MSTKLARLKLTTDPNAALLRRAFLYRGIFARVARRLGKSDSHVRRVARGERQSSKVLRALLEEIRRIERRAA